MCGVAAALQDGQGLASQGNSTYHILKTTDVTWQWNRSQDRRGQIYDHNTFSGVCTYYRPNDGNYKRILHLRQ
jgi:hypothetical protein